MIDFKGTSNVHEDMANPFAPFYYGVSTINKKKHLAVTAAGGKVIGTNLTYLDLKANSAISVWAKFPAPPAGVDKITIVIAKTPPFEDVPLK